MGPRKAPPGSTLDARYIEPVVALLIIANGVMIGLQVDPVHQDPTEQALRGPEKLITNANSYSMPSCQLSHGHNSLQEDYIGII